MPITIYRFPVRIVFCCSREEFDLKEMLSKVHSMFLPYKVLLLADQSKGQEYKQVGSVVQIL